MFRSAICRTAASTRSPSLFPSKSSLFLSRCLYRYTRPVITSSRYFSVSRRCWQDKELANTSNTSSATLSNSTPPEEDNLIYNAPLTATFRRVKIFSVSSLALSCTLAPFLFIIEGQLPAFARIALAVTAISTSGVSTALVGWVTKPYATSLRRLDASQNNGHKGLEITTHTLLLQPRLTRVYDLGFLTGTERPFAKWQLAREVVLPSDSQPPPSAGLQETVAETMDKDGKILGRWVVTWKENGVGECKAAGSIVRHFNVHPELISIS